MGTVVLSDKANQFSQLETKYHGFFAPAFEVLIDGESLLRNSVAITRITVQTSVEQRANAFSFSVENAFDLVKREFKWLDKYFQLGKYLEIKMGYRDVLETLFYGLITSVDLNYPAEGNPSITVRGMDISFLMMKGKHSQTWHTKKNSEVASEIGAKYATELEINDTTEPLDIIEQHLENDYQFLTRIAEEENFDFFIVGKTMYFRKPLTKKEPVVTLTWGRNLRSFSTDMNLAGQVSQVVVRGWDEKNSKTVEGDSSSIDVLGSNSKTGKDIMNVLGNFKEYIYTNVTSEEEARARASSRLNAIGMGLITGKGESIGLPEIRAGRYIKLEGVGKKMDQPYYITSATHTISSSGYLTSFSVQGNAV